MSSRSVQSEPLQHSYGDPDIYGRRHDTTGDTIFESQERPNDSEMTAFDALSITELDEGYKPNVHTYWDPPRLQPGQTVPNRMIVTSPNVTWMPYVSLLLQYVRARADGRFGLADFTVCPQWWIESQYHLAFVRTRPPAALIKGHALSFCWWDVNGSHFVRNEGTAYGDLGLLRSDIADNLRKEARNLRELCGTVTLQKDQGRLSYLVNKLVDAAIQLKFCNFTMRDLVYRVAGFQRLYLETLAMYEWHTKWGQRRCDMNGKIYEVDESVMGAITDQVECVSLLYRIGIPVWYVRPPADVPLSIIVRYVVPPGSKRTPTVHGRDLAEFDSREFVSIDYHRPFPTVVANVSPRSSEYVTACQTWKEGHLGAFEPQPIVKPPPSGLAVVESFAGPSRTENMQIRSSPYPSSSSATNTSTTIDVNRDKFFEPEETFVPPQSPVWKKALAAVDSIPSRVVSSPEAKKLRGYQFPDPFLLMKATNRRNMTLAWLMMRSQWLQSLVSVDALPLLPTPHHWKNFMHEFATKMQLTPATFSQRTNTSANTLQGTATTAKKSRPGGKDAQESNTKRRSRKAKEVQSSIFAGAVALTGRPETVYWGDLAVMQGEVDNLTPKVTAEIIWNLFEQNFRFEIRHLDWLLRPDLWSSDATVGSREDQIRQIFPLGSNEILVERMPRMTIGLAATDWQNRLSYVKALLALVASWPGETALQQMDLTTICPDDFDRIENAVVLRYCQNFFDQFGRAPCTPHQVPE